MPYLKPLFFTAPLISILPLAVALTLATGCGAISGAPMSPLAYASRPAPGYVVVDAPKEHNTEGYDRIVDNPFLRAKEAPLSTFSIDVDTASYSNIRRFLNDGRLPPPDAVRIEEMINYFSYDYATPTDGSPFAANTEVTTCPWAPNHRLLRIGLQSKRIATDQVSPRNFVFLLDVSGSMEAPNKLPLLRQAFAMLAEGLRAEDTISIVTYAGKSGLVLPATPGNDLQKIRAALDSLKASGSTNGGEGIELAYRIARENLKKGGINRVILATDGDFNVGVSSQGGLLRMVEKEREGGVFLTVLGFGMDNLKDSMMEQLADKGNGNYAYIDTLQEAKKVLVEQAGATFVTVAKDVKIQIEFNPTKVQAYRLIGYENRMLQAQDFNDDKKDAGEIGAGHSVTAIYELIPPNAPMPTESAPQVDALKYQTPPSTNTASTSNELATLKIRYKAPDGNESKLTSFAIADRATTFSEASTDLHFASAVAAFGMLLRNSPYKGDSNLGWVRTLAQSSLGRDPSGYRAEFVELVQKAAQLKGESKNEAVIVKE